MKRIMFVLSIFLLIFALFGFCPQPALEPAMILTSNQEPPAPSHPCYFSDEDCYIHAWLDETWSCPRCGEYIGPKYGFTDDEIYLLAQMLCGDKTRDGDGEYDFDFDAPDDINHFEVSKVLCVVMNRVRDQRFPNTVTEVIMQKGQFVVMPANAQKTPSDIALWVTQQWCISYDQYDIGVQCIPENHVFFSGDDYSNTTRSEWIIIP